jgi:electron transfer flavoprotein beta subunit
VRRIFSPERAKGEIIGDGVNKPVDTANLLVDKLVAKDIVSL